MKKLSGVILTGGKSTRMGRDKSLLEIEGKTLLQHAVDLLFQFFDEIYIVGSSALNISGKNIHTENDLYENSGPIGGIHASLNATKNSVLVIPVDMPFLDKIILEKMIISRNLQYDVIVAKSDRGVEPLVAIYEYRLLLKIENKIKSKNLALHKFFDDVKVKFVDFSNEKYISNRFLNLNYYAEYEQTLSEIKQTGN